MNLMVIRMLVCIILWYCRGNNKKESGTQLVLDKSKNEKKLLFKSAVIVYE